MCKLGRIKSTEVEREGRKAAFPGRVEREAAEDDQGEPWSFAAADWQFPLLLSFIHYTAPELR